MVARLLGTYRAGWRLRLVAVFVALAAAAACGGEPPTAPTPTPNPPPVVAAPVINSLTVGATRAEAGLGVDLTANVTDASPNTSALTYLWTANFGVVSITGPGTATWRLDKGVINTGVDVVVTLTVVKPYQVLVAGQLANREHRVAQSAPAFRAHDSDAEIRRITQTFLVEYFANSSVGPDACLVDFSVNCAGRLAERADIVKNRAERIIRSAQVSIQSVEFDGNRTFAWIVAPCTFRDIEIASGRGFIASGSCELTAVYEQRRWWLCDSFFRNGTSVPGRAPSHEPLPGDMRYWMWSLPES